MVNELFPLTPCTGLIALIPARSGSKGIPHKNLKVVCGKPLIAWSILSALNSESIDSVFVSTDCEDIARVASSYGAEVPFIRPAELATDSATTESVLEHFCDYLIGEKCQPREIMLLQPTSPVRLNGSIDAAYAEYKSKALDSLVSVSGSDRFMWHTGNDGHVSASYDFFNRPRRQDLSEDKLIKLENGSIYISDFTGLVLHKNRLFGRVGLYEMSKIESFEVDDLVDLIVAESLLEFLEGKN